MYVIFLLLLIGICNATSIQCSDKECYKNITYCVNNIVIQSKYNNCICSKNTQRITSANGEFACLSIPNNDQSINFICNNTNTLICCPLGTHIDLYLGKCMSDLGNAIITSCSNPSNFTTCNWTVPYCGLINKVPRNFASYECFKITQMLNINTTAVFDRGYYGKCCANLNERRNTICSSNFSDPCTNCYPSSNWMSNGLYAFENDYCLKNQISSNFLGENENCPSNIERYENITCTTVCSKGSTVIPNLNRINSIECECPIKPLGCELGFDGKCKSQNTIGCYTDGEFFFNVQEPNCDCNLTKISDFHCPYDCGGLDNTVDERGRCFKMLTENVTTCPGLNCTGKPNCHKKHSCGKSESCPKCNKCKDYVGLGNTQCIDTELNGKCSVILYHTCGNCSYLGLEKPCYCVGDQCSFVPNCTTPCGRECCKSLSCLNDGCGCDFGRFQCGEGEKAICCAIGTVCNTTNSSQYTCDDNTCPPQKLCPSGCCPGDTICNNGVCSCPNQQLPCGSESLCCFANQTCLDGDCQFCQSGNICSRECCNSTSYCDSQSNPSGCANCSTGKICGENFQYCCSDTQICSNETEGQNCRCSVDRFPCGTDNCCENGFFCNLNSFQCEICDGTVCGVNNEFCCSAFEICDTLENICVSCGNDSPCINECCNSTQYCVNQTCQNCNGTKCGILGNLCCEPPFECGIVPNIGFACVCPVSQQCGENCCKETEQCDIGTNQCVCSTPLCNGVCCNSTYYCNPTTDTCTQCNGNICGVDNELCCKETEFCENNQCKCLEQYLCIDNCCNIDQQCNDQGGTCEPCSTILCNGVCCNSTEYCAQESCLPCDGTKCPGMAGNICCGPGYECIITPEGYICVCPGELDCGNNCCNSTQTCDPINEICLNCIGDQVCGSECCNVTSYCDKTVDPNICRECDGTICASGCCNIENYCSDESCTCKIGTTPCGNDCCFPNQLCNRTNETFVCETCAKLCGEVCCKGNETCNEGACRCPTNTFQCGDLGLCCNNIESCSLVGNEYSCGICNTVLCGLEGQNQVCCPEPFICDIFDEQLECNCPLGTTLCGNVPGGTCCNITSEQCDVATSTCIPCPDERICNTLEGIVCCDGTNSFCDNAVIPNDCAQCPPNLICNISGINTCCNAFLNTQCGETECIACPFLRNCPENCCDFNEQCIPNSNDECTCLFYNYPCGDGCCYLNQYCNETNGSFTCDTCPELCGSVCCFGNKVCEDNQCVCNLPNTICGENCCSESEFCDTSTLTCKNNTIACNDNNYCGEFCCSSSQICVNQTCVCQNGTIECGDFGLCCNSTVEKCFFDSVDGPTCKSNQILCNGELCGENAEYCCVSSGLICSPTSNTCECNNDFTKCGNTCCDLSQNEICLFDNTCVPCPISCGNTCCDIGNLTCIGNQICGCQSNQTQCGYICCQENQVCNTAIEVCEDSLCTDQNTFVCGYSDDYVCCDTLQNQICIISGGVPSCQTVQP